MIRAGLCDILASDYYYPAMLAAITRLMADGVGTLPDLWKLVSTNPALASNLPDRGRIEPGLRADLVLIDWPEGGLPAVRQTWVAGRPAYRAQAKKSASRGGKGKVRAKHAPYASSCAATSSGMSKLCVTA